MTTAAVSGLQDCSSHPPNLQREVDMPLLPARRRSRNSMHVGTQAPFKCKLYDYEVEVDEIYYGEWRTSADAAAFRCTHRCSTAASEPMRGGICSPGLLHVGVACAVSTVRNEYRKTDLGTDRVRSVTLC